MSSEEKAPDTHFIKIEPCASVLCTLFILFVVMGLMFAPYYYSSVSIVLAHGLSVVVLAILLLAVQVRFQTEQK